MSLALKAVFRLFWVSKLLMAGKPLQLFAPLSAGLFLSVSGLGVETLLFFLELGFLWFELSWLFIGMDCQLQLC